MYHKKTETVVVNIRWEKCDLFIGRPSKWGNPFIIGRDGDRKEVVKKYHDWILTQKKLMTSLHELKGKRLGCFCAPLECHGNILVNLIAQYVKSKSASKKVYSLQKYNSTKNLGKQKSLLKKKVLLTKVRSGV